MKILFTLSLLLTLCLSTVALRTQAQLTNNLVISEIFYNTPGAGNDTVEYLEIYNNGNTDVDMSNYQLTTGVLLTFPQMTLHADSFLLVSKYADRTQQYLNKQSLQWTSGSLNNGGERITLADTSGALVDTVHYLPVLPWDTMANGHGYALVLCDPNSDNADPANWSTMHQYMGFFMDSLFGTPGSSCAAAIVDTTDSTASAILNVRPSHDLQIIGNAVVIAGWSEGESLEVFDVLGNRCFAATTVRERYEFSQLPAGMYVVRLSRNHQAFDTRRMVISKR